MKKIMMIFAIFFFVAFTHAIDMDDISSITPGGGRFYAIRHTRSDGKPLIEIIGSPIALQRARNQAMRGGYELEIKGPFSWHTHAAKFVRQNWDPGFGGKRRKRIIPGG